MAQHRLLNSPCFAAICRQTGLYPLDKSACSVVLDICSGMELAVPREDDMIASLNTELVYTNSVLTSKNRSPESPRRVAATASETLIGELVYQLRRLSPELRARWLEVALSSLPDLGSLFVVPSVPLQDGDADPEDLRVCATGEIS